MRTYFVGLGLGLCLVLGGVPSALALQSGGVEIGDLETGSVVGQPFAELDVDLSLTAANVAGSDGWYPPTSVLNLTRSGTGGRAGRPVLIKVTNKLQKDYTFHLSADSSHAGPWSMEAKVHLKPGETKYIGIPTSDLTYVTANNVLNYSNPESGDPKGQLIILR
ncbi:MAG: hypothetical protein MRJ96_10190 [Nitrospirales bacterium]|nr:hypothetical protein [Nitrospira sp.]MDR4501807.1 hypothetical protein [Nitrospirales bacterium]